MVWAARYYAMLDSLAVDSEGNICVADIPHGGITVVSQEGKLVRHVAIPDMFTTNVCLGGPETTRLHS